MNAVTDEPVETHPRVLAAKKNGRLAAYPSSSTSWHALTKRELFAAMAMQGLLAGTVVMTPDDAAADAVVFADALLLELEA